MDDIKFMTGFTSSRSWIRIGHRDAITRFYGGSHRTTRNSATLMKDCDRKTTSWSWPPRMEMDLASLEKASEEAPIIKLVNLNLTIP